MDTKGREGTVWEKEEKQPEGVENHGRTGGRGYMKSRDDNMCGKNSDTGYKTNEPWGSNAKQNTK